MEELFSVSTRNVDPAELATLLRNKFGRGGFRIEMRHSTYRVYATRGRIEANSRGRIPRLVPLAGMMPLPRRASQYRQRDDYPKNIRTDEHRLS
ncbi:hypothetical protein F5X97DRAFT_297215 [Nemania serpens]|nr:hypothetical protein F5X97DRAFT_297215 [Nemania serpens]